MSFAVKTPHLNAIKRITNFELKPKEKVKLRIFLVVSGIFSLFLAVIFSIQTGVVTFICALTLSYSYVCVKQERQNSKSPTSSRIRKKKKRKKERSPSLYGGNWQAHQGETNPAGSSLSVGEPEPHDSFVQIQKSDLMSTEDIPKRESPPSQDEERILSKIRQLVRPRLSSDEETGNYMDHLSAGIEKANNYYDIYSCVEGLIDFVTADCSGKEQAVDNFMEEIQLCLLDDIFEQRDMTRKDKTTKLYLSLDTEFTNQIPIQDIFTVCEAAAEVVVEDCTCLNKTEHRHLQNVFTLIKPFLRKKEEGKYNSSPSLNPKTLDNVLRILGIKKTTWKDIIGKKKSTFKQEYIISQLPVPLRPLFFTATRDLS